MIRLPHDRVEEWQSNNCDEISGGNHRRRAQSHGKHSSLRIAVEWMELPFPSRTCQLFVFICCVRARVFSVPRSHATLTLFREREPIGVDGPDNVEILGPFPELVASDIAHAFPLCALCALSVLCRRLRLSRRRATSLFAQYPRTPSLLFAKRPTPPPPPPMRPTTGIDRRFPLNEKTNGQRTALAALFPVCARTREWLHLWASRWTKFFWLSDERGKKKSSKVG